jgi:UDP-N-acetylmuramate--alanine ligase
MHIYFIGAGGAGISALANIALDLGYQVSGSDSQMSQNIKDLSKRGARISTSQSGKELSVIHENDAIDWVVYSSSISPDSSELLYAKEQNIKSTKRDFFINFLLKKFDLKLIAVCGTHGKTTTTAMLAWLFRSFDIPACHIIGSNMSWARSGEYNKGAKYLILEADEYDRHFLAYQSLTSILTTLDHDHFDTYPTAKEYLEAFHTFLAKQSKKVFGFSQDLKKLGIDFWEGAKRDSNKFTLLKREFGGRLADYDGFNLPGLHNRQNAALAASLFSKVIKPGLESVALEAALSEFPGTQRRLEKLAPGVYSDYAHHPVEIKATVQAVTEIADKIAVIYQPHQNARQIEIAKDYEMSFEGANEIFWLPTYLTRENPEQEVLSPDYFVKNIVLGAKAQSADLDEILISKLQDLKRHKYTLLFLGAGSIDAWLRENLDNLNYSQN